MKQQITRKVWLRKPFHEAENHTGKTIVFGHTPVYGLLNKSVAQLSFGLQKMARLGWMEELFMVVSSWNCLYRPRNDRTPLYRK